MLLINSAQRAEGVWSTVRWKNRLHTASGFPRPALSYLRRFTTLLAGAAVLGCASLAQTGDVGAQIVAADAALGAQTGEILIAASGTVSEGKVSLSEGHDLVCLNNVTIYLNAGSYFDQHSHTRIKNCIISSTSVPVLGEIQSINTDSVTLENVTFIGGGNLLYWSGVSNFTLSHSTIQAISASDHDTHNVTSGLVLINCSHGTIDNVTVNPFVFPAGNNNPSIIGLSLSNDIDIENPVIHGVDASYVRLGAGAIAIAGSANITVNGGAVTDNANIDGILSQSYGNTPSSHLTITGINSSHNGRPGLNANAPLGLGDGIDVINTSHVAISHCILNGNGSLHDQQPGIWIFLDDDVVVSDCDISDGSMAGVAAAGSPTVRLIRDSINRNQASGVFTEFQGGTATNVGTKVSFVSGVSGGFGLSWAPGTPFVFDGITYQVASVIDSEHLTLSTSPVDHSSPAPWAVNTTQDIIDSVIDDNGLGQFGGQDQVGISWADGTSGTISGVTATNTQAGMQLFGLELENTATATLDNDNFFGNVDGGSGISALPQTLSMSSVAFPAQALATVSSAQTITLKAGAIAIQGLLIKVSGDFAETDNCGSAVPAFASCQILIAFTPKLVGARYGILTVSDHAPHSPQVASLSGTGVSFGIGLTVATGASSWAAIPAGTTATYDLSIGGAGIGGLVSLSCMGTPANAVCNLPATLAINSRQPTLLTATVSTQPVAAGTRSAANSKRRPWPWLATAAGFLFLPMGASRKQSSARYARLVVLLLLASLCFCGQPRSSPKNVGGTPPGTYTIIVSARMGSTTDQIPLTLVVR